LKTLEGKKKQADDVFIKYYDDYTSGKDFMENMWIADASTMCHVTNDDSGLYEVTEVTESVRLGNGHTVYSTKKGKLEVVLPTMKKQKGTTITLENVQYVPKFPVKLFSLLIVLKNGAEIKSANRKLTISKRVSGCASIAFTFTARDDKAKSRYVLGIELKPKVRKIEKFQIYKHRSNQNARSNMGVTASTESYAESKNSMKIYDKPVDHDGVDKVMQKNEKTTDFDDSFLQSDREKHEESNDAVIFNGEMLSDTDNDDQMNKQDWKSNSIDSDETTMCNDEMMVFDADFCRDGIVDNKESIDAKRMTKNDDLMTENNDRNNESDLQGIAEEIDAETEFATKTNTSLITSTEETMENATTKSLNKKDKKMDEKTMVIGMAIAQQQKLFLMRRCYQSTVPRTKMRHAEVVPS